jgi:anthraniloyl-CoA monooxygenase
MEAGRMNLQKINIIGAGPAGLYFAILMRDCFPDSKINVYERARADDIAGWGIVINEGTVRLLEKYDADSYQEIIKQSKRWSDVETRYKGEQIRVRGKGYISMSRNVLVSALRKRCNALDIEISFEKNISEVSEFEDCDLLVGADGARSTVRQTYVDSFQTSVDYRKDRFIWLGTKARFDTITHIIRPTATGLFTAECYPYSDTYSSFIPTLGEETWQSSGFEAMSVEEAVKYMAGVFEEELEGQPLLFDAASHWRQFPHITNGHWSHKNILLIGDALRTAHFSIGSGTRLAIEDTIVASQCLSTCNTVSEGLAEFEKRRRPLMNRLEDVAFESMQWFENVEDHLGLDIIPFTYELMTRTSSLGEKSLKLTDPEFLKLYRDYKVGRSQANG